MKRWIVILIFAAFPFVCSAMDKAELNRLWDDANTEYVNGEYVMAADIYQSILDAGHTGHKLFYNMGNACFKSGQIGKAVLMYNRALRIKPNDADTKYNLEVINVNYLKDKIEVVPEFFLVRWVGAFRLVMGSNGWAAVSILFFALLLASALVYLLAGKMSLRKTGFYLTIVFALFFILSLAFSIMQRKQFINSDEAVVMRSAISIKSSPDDASKDIFILHEGTKIKIVGELGEWREIEIADGNKGWIPMSSIERI